SERANKNRRAPGPAARSHLISALACKLDVGGLLAAAAAIILDLEGDLVALIEDRNAGPLQSGGVHEDVLAAVFGLNKAEAARMIEEFHGAVHTSHGGIPFPLKLTQTGHRAPNGDLRRL